MKQASRGIMSGEKGSVIIIVAAAMVLLLGIAALVVDVGLLYYNKASLSNAADAAALAGVQELPKDHTKATETAVSYAASNGVETSQVSAEVLPDGRGIRVETSRVVPLGFARILGFNATRVAAEATARVGAVKSAKGVVPFGVVWDDFQFGEQRDLRVGPGDPSAVRGNFGGLALGGRGRPIFTENIKHGYEGVLKVGDEVSTDPTLLETEPGVMAKKTKDAVQYRLDGCEHDPPCTIDHFVKGCPRIVITPVVKTFEHVEGRDKVELLGFAAFILEDTYIRREGNDEHAYVKGRFIEWAADGDLGNINDYGVVSYRLDN